MKTVLYWTGQPDRRRTTSAATSPTTRSTRSRWVASTRRRPGSPTRYDVETLDEALACRAAHAHPGRAPPRARACQEVLARRRPQAAARWRAGAGRPCGWCRCWRRTTSAGWSPPAAPAACRPLEPYADATGFKLDLRGRASARRTHRRRRSTAGRRPGRGPRGGAAERRRAGPVHATGRCCRGSSRRSASRTRSSRRARCWSPPAHGRGRRRRASSGRLTSSRAAACGGVTRGSGICCGLFTLRSPILPGSVHL